MSAVQTIESLLRLGVLVKDAAHKHGGLNAAFLKSPEYGKIEGTVKELLAELKPDDFKNAVAEVEKKQAALLIGYGSIGKLPYERLVQYDQLSSARLKLATEWAKKAREDAGFFSWLVDDALPVLAQAAKVIIPLLL
jgi:hypothetical protein